MSFRDHLELLQRGVGAWNDERRRYSFRPEGQLPARQSYDLSGADLQDFHLASADLVNVDLSEANLSGANLVNADLRGAIVINSNLAGADLTGANLTLANLFGASLQRANLRDSVFGYTDLTGVDFTGARMGMTYLCAVDLKSAKGLEATVHTLPSTVGIDTVYLSEGRIPEYLLRGVGVPDSLIDYAKSLVGSAIQFYSCFISYSTADQEFADRLYADLQLKGVRCWFAPHDVQAGRKLHEQIDEAIRLHDKVLLILSPHSMSSEWVRTEISKARRREIRDCGRVLFPISLAPFIAIRDWECFDADTGKDSAREIREYYIPDFSNWKDHDSYQRGFAKLLNDLSADGRTNRR